MANSLTEAWILENLFSNVGDTNYYSPGVGEGKLFPFARIIYSTSLSRSLFGTIMDGVGTKAPFLYSDLQSHLASLTNADLADMFFITDPDNCFSNLEFVRSVSFKNSLASQLDILETRPAEQGGDSYLGLLAQDRSWLLDHTYSPGNSFAISLYGSEMIVKNLLNVLGVKDVQWAQ